MTKFILIRHGYSIYNKENRYTGHLDIDLDERGYLQAEKTSKYVLENFKIDSVYSSDLKRAYETVKPIADALGISVIKDKAFREIDVGIWQGMLFEDINRLYPKESKERSECPDTFRFIDGESIPELRKRFADAIDKIAKENEGKTIVIGTHGGAVRAIVSFYQNILSTEVKVPNSCITVGEYENGKMTFSLVGYNEHIKEIET